MDENRYSKAQEWAEGLRSARQTAPKPHEVFGRRKARRFEAALRKENETLRLSYCVVHLLALTPAEAIGLILYWTFRQGLEEDASRSVAAHLFDGHFLSSGLGTEDEAPLQEAVIAAATAVRDSQAQGELRDAFEALCECELTIPEVAAVIVCWAWFKNIPDENTDRAVGCMGGGSRKTLWEIEAARWATMNAISQMMEEHFEEEVAAAKSS